ncbi:MAG: RsmF rRNA methyltransferase first C-terminal domain-containing protein, partial [Chloroflexota bacterium]
MPVNSPVPVPALFLDRMKNFLGDAEFPAFSAAMDGDVRSGLRVNTLKVSLEEFRKLSPFALGDAVPWCSSAAFLEGGSRPGLHPYHSAGIYYLQDPSAMSAAELLAPLPGERVLDLSAAPGGKTTQIAALMQGQGLLVANEIKDKRVGHLAQNVERWGAGNILITNETPERLSDHFGAYFDRVLVDAPCSGEGMFRKDMGARADWSPEMVSGCAVRQKNILRVAVHLVKPGGFLFYSTCTFAPEEDEGVINQILQENKDFEVVQLHRYPGFTGGRPEWIDADASLQGAVRLFPHLISGEGHFACMLQRKQTEHYDRVKTARITNLPRQLAGYWEIFSANLKMEFARDRLFLSGERLYYIPQGMPDSGHLRIIHPGVWLGTFKKDRFEPAHPLSLFLKKGQAENMIDHVFCLPFF